MTDKASEEKGTSTVETPTETADEGKRSSKSDEEPSTRAKSSASRSAVHPEGSVRKKTQLPREAK